jgi:hypothetical protein
MLYSDLCSFASPMMLSAYTSVKDLPTRTGTIARKRVSCSELIPVDQIRVVLHRSELHHSSLLTDVIGCAHICRQLNIPTIVHPFSTYPSIRSIELPHPKIVSPYIQVSYNCVTCIAIHFHLQSGLTNKFSKEFM